MSEYKFIGVEKSKNKKKKFSAVFENRTTHTLKRINFGESGYEDYLMHNDENRQKNYILRHQAREDWSDSGIMTSGWWSRHLLWSYPDIKDAMKDIFKKLKNAKYL